MSELTLQFQANRTRLTAKSFRLQCIPLLVWSAEVVVGRLAAGLRLRYVRLSRRSLRLLEINSPARDGSSRSKPRYSWQRKISSLFERLSQHIGVSRAVRGVKGRAYVVDKGGVRAEGWCSLEAPTLIFYLGLVVWKQLASLTAISLTFVALLHLWIIGIKFDIWSHDL